MGKEDHWIYRGEANADWWLKPTIERFQESLLAPRRPYSIADLENQLLYDFRSSAHQFLANLPSETEKLEWLAVLQHYGTPTRLLDWTYSPTVAAYFALRSKPEGAERACIWALNLHRLKQILIKRLGKKDWRTTYEPCLTNVMRDAKPALITPFLPQNRYSRMSGQQGLFLVKTGPRRQAQSSTPRTLTSPACSADGPWLRSRRIVSALQLIPNFVARRYPASPPNA
jgi:hypothetical protein